MSRNVETGTVPRISFTRETRGLSSKSRTRACAVAEELVSPPDSSGHSLVKATTTTQSTPANPISRWIQPDEQAQLAGGQAAALLGRQRRRGRAWNLVSYSNSQPEQTHPLELTNPLISTRSKDREILRGDPHKLIEGCVVAGRAMNATAGQSPATPLPHPGPLGTVLTLASCTQLTSTSAESSSSSLTTSSRPSTRPTRPASLARTLAARATRLTFTSTAGLEPTSAERRQP